MKFPHGPSDLHIINHFNFDHGRNGLIGALVSMVGVFFNEVTLYPIENSLTILSNGFFH